MKLTSTLYLTCTLSILTCLTGCGAITRGVLSLHKSNSYPPAQATTKTLLTHPPSINLQHYKSVQTSMQRPYQRSDLAIAVAASGGGYRAANLTAGVLLGLEKLKYPSLKGNLLQEVDYFSTVSGGGLAVGLYLANQYRFLQKHPKALYHYANDFYHPKIPLKPRLRIDYSDDLFFGYRRTINLEAKLTKNLLMVKPHRDLKLGDIFIDKADAKHEPKLPLWVTNSMIMQNFNLFQFTPYILSKYKISKYIHNHQILKLNRHKTRRGTYDMPYSVGMTASATFPYAVSGTTLWSDDCRKQCYLQLFDGGLVDNLGIYSAVEMLKQDPAKYKVLIIIDAYHEAAEPFSKSRIPPRKLALLDKVLNSGPNAFQRQMRQFAPLITKNMLCEEPTEEVLVVYLDLYKSPKTHHVDNALWMSEDDQNIMLETGKKLVLRNRTLTQQLPRLLEGHAFNTCTEPPNMLFKKKIIDMTQRAKALFHTKG